ncbi:MAG: helix-turn-helix domain-containing protein [Cytophagales bacterium]|nr:helix-turn-helix domain-containing protein [Cytophagales bacterium]
MEHTTKPRPKHLGRKVRQVRELLSLTQEEVAEKMGISQQAVSNIESNETVEREQLDRVAKAMGVSPEAIRYLDEDATIYNIVTNNDQKGGNSNALNFSCTFNPLDKLMEAIEKNEKLYETLIKEKEALLKSEREKVAMLEKFLEERK